MIELEIKETKSQLYFGAFQIISVVKSIGACWAVASDTHHPRSKVLTDYFSLNQYYFTLKNTHCILTFHFTSTGLLFWALCIPFTRYCDLCLITNFTPVSVFVMIVFACARFYCFTLLTETNFNSILAVWAAINISLSTARETKFFTKYFCAFLVVPKIMSANRWPISVPK